MNQATRISLIALITSFAFAMPAPAAAAAATPAKPAQQITLGTPHFFALSVADLDASTRWYRDLFGLSVGQEFSAPDSSLMGRVLTSPNLTVELAKNRFAKPRAEYTKAAPVGADPLTVIHGIVKVGITVSSLDAAIAVLQARGITIDGQWLQSKPRNLLIHDVDGNLIQLFERATPVKAK